MAGEKGHIRLHAQCGACGYTFKADDRLVALLGSSDSTFYAAYDAYTFQDSGYYCLQGEGNNPWLFCRSPRCRRCASGLESVTVHVDCFKLVLRESTTRDKLHRFWQAAAWKYPWHQVAFLGLPHNVNISSSMHLAGEVCHIHKLQWLPTEIAQMIWNYSRLNMLWRLNSVLEFVRNLSTAKNDELISMPLCKVYTWHRGGSPITREGFNEPIIRLTIDSQGLREIERLSATPKIGGFRSDTVVYVVEPAECFSNVDIQFKLGLSRLRIPAESRGFQIWDTPTPPVIQQCLLIPRIRPDPYCRFATIDIRNCTGITFFILAGSTYGIHAHTPSRPYAQTTFERLPPLGQIAAWVYIPLRDSLTAFGIRLPMYGKLHRSTLPCFLLRTNLLGDITAGPCYDGRTEDFVVGTGSQLTLIHEITEIGPIAAVGVYPKGRECVKMSHPSPVGDAPFYGACFSSAPLQDVTSTQIFYDEETGLCRGIIIQYRNGLERALGQCRVGVDPFQSVTKPSHLCFAPTTHYRPNTEVELHAVKVEGTVRPTHEHDGTGWECCAMGGILEFWFVNDQAKLNYIKID